MPFGDEETRSRALGPPSKAVGFVPHEDDAEELEHDGDQEEFEQNMPVQVPQPDVFFSGGTGRPNPGGFRPFRDTEEYQHPPSHPVPSANNSFGSSQESDEDDAAAYERRAEAFLLQGQGGEYIEDDGNLDDSMFESQAHDGDEEDEQYDGDDAAGVGGRWAPALTPITERTYEMTGNTALTGRNWSTPLELRDRSLGQDEDEEEGMMTTDTAKFGQDEAMRAAERLAEELRDQHDEEDDVQVPRSAGENFQVWQEDEANEGPPETPPSLDNTNEPPPPVDPYTTTNKSRIIQNLPVPTSHRDLGPRAFAGLEKLQRFVKAQAARRGSKEASSSSSSLGRKGVAVDGDVYPLVLDGDTFEVTAKLGEGGFGAVFLATDVALRARLEADDRDPEDISLDLTSALVAVKVVKPAILWESYALERIHDTLPPSLLPSIIKPHALYIYGDESYHVLEFSHHGTLLEAVNKAGDLHIGPGLGTSVPGLDEMLAMFFTVELLRAVEGLHQEGFIHGDLKIDNCMVRIDKPDLNDSQGLSTQYDPTGGGGWAYNGVKLIDFGRAIDRTLWPHEQEFIMNGDWKVDKRDCREIRDGQSWTFETDYYGLAGIVYVLLFGKYMEMPVMKTVDGFEVQKLPASLKRYWKTELWEPLFDALLNPHRFGRALPIVGELAEIRERMEEWLVENSNKTSRRTNLKTLIRRLSALNLS